MKKYIENVVTEKNLLDPIGELTCLFFYLHAWLLNYCLIACLLKCLFV